MKKRTPRRSSWGAGLRRAVRSARRIVVIGVGHPDRSDDAAGVLASRETRRRLGKAGGRTVLILEGGEVPESLTGRIRKFGPDLVIFIDAASGGRRPGTTFLVEKGDLAEEIVSSHRLPLGLLLRYIEKTMGAATAVLGIQPSCLEPGEPPTPAVSAAVLRLGAKLGGFLRERE